MAELFRKSRDVYQLLFDELADHTTKHWSFVAKPYMGIALLSLYLMFVLKWGPQWMKNRPAFKLDKILMVYNLFQVAACIYVFVQSIRYAWGYKYKLICQPVDNSNTEQAYIERKLVYLYFLLKLTDLLDTVFFVLRKKFNQVSFLHVYHHAGMVLLVWGVITYYPGGHGTLIGVINLFVHVFMYSYYFLTVAVPSVKQSLMFKKMITQIQLVQFFLSIIHMSAIIFKVDCEYPRFAAPLVIPHNVFLFILFADFYIKTYIKIPKTVDQTNGVNKEQSNGNITQYFMNNVNGINNEDEKSR